MLPGFSMTNSTFGPEMREKHFSFASMYTPLNHGTYGASPRVVLDYRRQLQDEAEARPDIFMRYTYRKLLNEARASMAPMLGAYVDEVVFIPSATAGVNTVLRNLEWKKGEVLLYFTTIAPSCQKTVDSLSETTDVETYPIDISFPTTDDEILRLFCSAVVEIHGKGKTPRMAIFDTILSFPGMRFPWEKLVILCRELKILSLIDGAHGVGHIDLTHVGQIRPDFLVSDCYKLVNPILPHPLKT